MTVAQPPFQRCGAQKRPAGTGTCTLKAGWGTDHVGFGRCKLHGGLAPSGKKNGAMLQARWEIETWGGRLDVTPAEALLELVQTKAAEVAYWQHRVKELRDEERAGLMLVSTTDADGSTPRGPASKSVEVRSTNLHIFMQALHKAQDQLASYSAAALRAGVDEALVKLAAIQASAVIEFARKAMDIARRDPKADMDAILLALVEDENQ